MIGKKIGDTVIKKSERTLLNSRSTVDEVTDREKLLGAQIQRLKQEFKEYCEISKRNEEKNKNKTTVDFMGKILPVVDALERAKKIENHRFLRIGQKDVDNIKKNMEAIYDQFLSSLGLEEIHPNTGDELQYERHVAITKKESLYPDYTIIECVRKGYALDGIVVRPAEVIVSRYIPYRTTAIPLKYSGTIRYNP